MEAAAEPRQRVHVRVDGRPTEVFDQIVVEMDAVQAGLRRQNLLEIGEIVVDEMR
jgi:hypothetical protein